MKDGYYWIRMGGDPVIGEINEGGLWLIGDETEHSPAEADIIAPIDLLPR